MSPFWSFTFIKPETKWGLGGMQSVTILIWGTQKVNFLGVKVYASTQRLRTTTVNESKD
jgi:hypothetical protein